MMKPSSYHTTLFKRMLARIQRKPRGQSFIELALVVLILALLLSGVVEFGFLLNNYLHVLDGSREAARYSSSSTPFTMDPTGVNIASYYLPPFYYVAAGKAAQTMASVNPDGTISGVELNPSNPDDIVISVISFTGNTPTRYPSADPNGWSLCAHYKANSDDSAVTYSATPPTSCTGQPYGGFVSYFACIGASIPPQLPSSSWSAHCTARTSQFNNAAITGLLGSLVPPNTGAVLVEIFYNYPQLLKLPVLTSVVPDPLPLHVYSIMPLSAAQPTPTP
jgi:hypothetical protein